MQIRFESEPVIAKQLFSFEIWLESEAVADYEFNKWYEITLVQYMTPEHYDDVMRLESPVNKRVYLNENGVSDRLKFKILPRRDVVKIRVRVNKTYWQQIIEFNGR